MRKRLAGFVGVLVVLAVFLTACGDTSQTITFTYAVAKGQTSFAQFTSDKYYFEKVQADVAPKLTSFINSGDHNITEVDLSYSDNYLTSAVVYYDPNTTGEGNQLRLKLISSDKYYYEQIQPDVQKQLDAVQQTGLNIYKVQIVQDQGYTVAAVVWYLAS